MYFGFICAILAFSLYVGEGMPISPPPDENDCDFTTDLEVLAACKQRYMNRRMGLNPDQNEPRIGSKLDKHKEQLNSLRANGYMKPKIVDDVRQEKIELYKMLKSNQQQEGRRMLGYLSKLLNVEPPRQNAQIDQSLENESAGQSSSQPPVDAHRSILNEQSMSDDDQLVPDHSTAAAENSSKNVPKESTSEKRKRSEFIN
ncbi:hypothetical protein niasHS_001898 [Heterodera schachtii]|uniref:Secreted protein n=1 Tax=Heterodera schachtii TaxID=97005 RepID=A0ABD2KAX6_HETSC